MIQNHFKWGRPTNPDNWDFFKAKIEEIKKNKCAITFTIDFINDTFSPVLDIVGMVEYSSKDMFIKAVLENRLQFRDDVISVTVYA